jgi:hypothetical protein
LFGLLQYDFILNNLSWVRNFGFFLVFPFILCYVLLGSDVDVCSDILESFPPLPGMQGVELEMHEAPILLR